VDGAGRRRVVKELVPGCRRRAASAGETAAQLTVEYCVSVGVTILWSQEVRSVFARM
jgi:hypothetical protein